MFWLLLKKKKDLNKSKGKKKNIMKKIPLLIHLIGLCKVLIHIQEKKHFSILITIGKLKPPETMMILKIYSDIYTYTYRHI